MTADERQLEWQTIYGITYSVANTRRDIVYVWSGADYDVIMCYLNNVEREVERTERELEAALTAGDTENSWGDLRYGGPVAQLVSAPDS